MIDPLFIMRNVKLKLYCPGNLKINFSDHKRPICSLVEYVTTRKYDKKEQSIRRAEPPKRKNRTKNNIKSMKT
jgi:hypothetical protein